MLHKAKARVWACCVGGVFQRNTNAGQAGEPENFLEKFSGGFLGAANLGGEFGRAYFLLFSDFFMRGHFWQKQCIKDLTSRP